MSTAKSKTRRTRARAEKNRVPSRAADEVLRMALALPPDDQHRVAIEILECLEFGPPEDPKEVEKAWAAEIKRRVKDIDSGKSKLLTWDEVEKVLERKRRR